MKTKVIAIRVQPLSSQEALEKLCKTSPPRKIEYGVVKTLGSMGLAVFAVGSYLAAYFVIPAIRDADFAVDAWTSGILKMVTYLMGSAAWFPSVLLARDVVNSIRKPLDITPNRIFHTLKGYPSVFDINNSTVMNPVNTVDDLLNLVESVESSETSCEFLNGVEITDIKIKFGPTPLINPLPLVYYEVFIQGKLSGGGKISAKIPPTWDRKFVMGLKEGSLVFLSGTYEKETNTFDIREYGDALVHDNQ